MDNSKINMHKRMAMTGNYRGGGIAHGGMGKAMRKGGMGGRKGDMMYSRGYGVDEKSKRMPTMLMDRGPSKMKKGGMKQGYKAREDESLGMRTGKESGKKQSMKDRRDESYGAWGKRKSGKVNKKKGGSIKGSNRPRPQGPHMWVRGKKDKMRKGGHANTRRMNRLEELGRVDAEKAHTSKGRRNLKDEKRRIVRELKK
jgi:hypothetical protein|tara:strand:+ start:272 stop:868 length:597 start_codon:yes stop_codon:yes gene_type:complete